MSDTSNVLRSYRTVPRVRMDRVGRVEVFRELLRYSRDSSLPVDLQRYWARSAFMVWLRLNGKTWAEIAEIYGMSRQRVWQLVGSFF